MKSVHVWCMFFWTLLVIPPPTVFGQNVQSSPDYSNKSDILNGRRVLVQIDDIVLFGQKQRDSQFQDNGFNFYNSTNSTLSAPGQSSIASTAFAAAGVHPRVVSGRWWQSPTNVTAMLFNNGPDGLTVVLDRQGNSPSALISSGLADIPCLIRADFTGDGYDDMAVGWTNLFNGVAGVVLATATDTTKSSAPRFGPTLVAPRCMAMAKGDLNGDGQIELVYAHATAAGGVQITIYNFDKNTLAFTQAGSYTVNTAEGMQNPPPVTQASITAGSLRGDVRQQLAIAYGSNQGETHVIVKTIDVLDNLQMKEVDRFDTGSWTRNDGVIALRAERLFGTDPTNLREYLVFFFAWRNNANAGGANKYLKLFSVGDDLKLTAHPIIDFSGYACVFDFASGNFDNVVQDPLNQGQSEPSLDRQLALVGANTCDGPTTVEINVLTISPDFTSKITKSTVPAPFPGATNIAMIAADAQGRSMVLGEPNRVKLHNNLQTTVVVAAPPSHVDYITPLGGSKPMVLNISALPQGFKTSYSNQTRSQIQSSSTSGTSWGVGSSQSVNQTLSVGDVDAGEGFKEKSSFTAAQKFQGDSEKENGSSSGFSYDVSSSSGAGDNLWYTSNTLNVWTYPVLGRKVCPQKKPGCPDSEKVPLTLIYSAPDSLENGSTSQQTAQWYQPTWEYGNVFSYPVTLAQLQSLVPNFKLLTSDQQASINTGGNNPTSIDASWSSGNSSGTKSGFTQNYSFDASFSFQGAADYLGLSIGVGYSMDVSGSFGFSSQTTNKESLDTSTGLTINKPGALRGNEYAYNVTPYIYGRSKPANIVDTSKDPKEPVTSYGALRSAFTANVYSQGGTFWRQAYGTLPDIGLSHPARWQVKTESLQTPPPNCLDSGANNSEQTCFDVHQHDPTQVWNNTSLRMQGFFITNASEGSDPAQIGAGPSLTFTHAGSKLRLQARVYNFSLASLPPRSAVHVQFYGMAYNHQTGSPLTGVPFKIGAGDVVLDRIPALSDAASSRNWAYAQVEFDTTPYSDQYLTFWVVAWAQNANGTLVTELPGHGLNSVPPTVVNNMAAIPVEMNPNVDGTAMTTYSNNLGFYDSQLYVAPPLGRFQTVLATADKKAIRLAPVQLSGRSMLRNQQIEISTTIRPQAVAAPGAIVKFYDGHPDDGGSLIQAVVLPWIKPNEMHRVKVRYTAQKPGLRRVWAFVNHGTSYESARSSPILCVGGACFSRRTDGRVNAEEAFDPREKP